MSQEARLDWTESTTPVSSAGPPARPLARPSRQGGGGLEVATILLISGHQAALGSAG